MGRTFASRVSHPRLKWVILVFWLVLLWMYRRRIFLRI